MPKMFIVLIVALLVVGCRTNRVVNKQRVGLWIEHDTVNDIPYRSRGRYKKGIEVGRWRHYTNNVVSKYERYRDSTCHTIFYDDLGIKRLEGNTKLVIEDNYLHWYYFGRWDEYNRDGAVIRSRYYDKGQLTDSLPE